MPVVNRYTQLTGPRFDPLSFKEQALVPMQLRQQQDALEEQAGNLGIFDINRLAVDDPLVQQTIGDYEQQVADYSDRLQEEGFNELSRQGLRDLARERRALIAPTGTLGRAQAAYDAYQANKKQLGDMYKSGKISADKYQLGLQSALNQYNESEGVKGDATYNAFSAVKDEDIVKKGRQYALDIQRNPTKLQSLGFTARTLPDGTTRYYDTKSGREFTQKGAIASAVETLLKQDPAVVSDLTQRQQLGLIKDPNAYLKGLGQTFEQLYGVDNRTQSRSGFFNPLEIHRAKKALDESQDNESVPYVYDPVQSKQLANESLISGLTDVARGQTAGGRVVPVLNELGKEARAEAERDGRVYRPQRAHYDLTTQPQPADLQNSLDKKDRQRYDVLSQKMTDAGFISPDATDQEKAKAVADYLTKFKDVSYSNPIVKPLTASGPISSALLLNTKNLNRTNREVMNEIQGGRTKLWDKKGNPIEAKDLPDNMTIEYIGYVSPSNVLPKFKNGSAEQSVVPHVIQVMKDNKIWKEVYASRGDYETSKPEFEAYKIVKNTTNDGISTPGLPNTYTLDSSSPLYRAGLRDYSVSYDPRSKTYNIDATYRDGRTYSEQGMQPETYETFWYNVINAVNKKK